MQEKVLAIDPGPEMSAFVLMDGARILRKGKMENDRLLALLEEWDDPHAQLVIEWIAGYGLTVGQSVFETCRWVGVFQREWERARRQRARLLGRKEVKSLLCGNTTAKDQHVRECLIDRLGPVGTKKAPGPLHGVAGDMWAALAVAVAWMEKRQKP